ncbi:MAG: SRPBCC domain-containing protein, partial [Acidimicrobiia bacterium]
MPVTTIQKDTESLKMTVEAVFDAPVSRVWEMWENPRLLERWWGPPTYPATVVDHDLSVDGNVTYFMTGPEGDRHHGWWRIIAVDPPHKLELEDGFGDADGNPNPDMPTTTMRMELAAKPEGGTAMTIETTFPSLEAMGQMVEMGMEEGITQAVNQIDALL